MLTDKTLENEVVIACDPSAIPAESRARWIETGKQVYAAVQAVQEVPMGYRFRLPTDSALLLTVAEYISNERLCCAFLRFTVEIEPDRGPFWLRLTGGQGVKAYMQGIFETNDLLNESVAGAIGQQHP